VTEATTGGAASPFAADVAFGRRMDHLGASIGPSVEADLHYILGKGPADPIDAFTIQARTAAVLIGRYGLDSVNELALLALPVAAGLSRPPISGYRVAAVGIEAETGDLVLGGNLEFPGTELSTTVHAEGFVALRVRRRGRHLGFLAVREAHPCAHCRQTLAEAAGSGTLQIIDLQGHVLTLDDLYPWPFRPAALGVDADSPTTVPWPNLAYVPPDPPSSLSAALLELGGRAHAPYSGAPSAVVLGLPDALAIGAGCVESVAFNPSISALQAALVELAAARVDPSTITEGWLAKVDGGAVDPEPGFRALLGAVAPEASANVVRWRVDG
jgi:cytidine deaminase